MNKIINTFIKVEALFILFCLIFGTSMLNIQKTDHTDSALLSASTLANPGKQQKLQLRPTFPPTPVVIKISQADLTPAATREATPTQVPSTEARPTSTSTPRPVATTRVNTALPQAVVQIAANIRSGPGTNYGIVGGAQINTPLQVIGRNVDGSWLRICCVDDGGNWIYAQLIRLDEGTKIETISVIASASVESSSAKPAVSNLSTQPPAPSLPVPVAPRSIVTNHAVNLRVSPDTTSDVFGIAEAQQPFIVIGQTQNGQWLLVCCDKDKGKDAWIFSAFASPATDSAPNPLPTRTYRAYESSIQITDADSDNVNKSPRKTCAYADDANHLQLGNGRVEQMPTGKEGEWLISGRRFVATNRTSLERERNLFFPDPKAHRSEFRIGTRVDVEYCKQDGLNYALEIEIQP